MSGVQWKELAATSHYLTAQAEDEALRHGDVPQTRVQIEELIDALARFNCYALNE
jgi:hypothetical protein